MVEGSSIQINHGGDFFLVLLPVSFPFLVVTSILED